MRFSIPLFFVSFVSIISVSHKASGLETISTDEIRPGMKGYGLTVFQGTEPVRFGVEVISVVPNFVLRQNIILIRCDHPVTDRAGVIGGMSGSPIYIEGKLAGALAYGWKFNKEPVAGVTAIEDMLDVLKLKLRKGRALLNSPLTLKSPPQERRSVRERAFFNLFGKGEREGIVPARTPLTLGGFSSEATEIIADGLQKYGIDPVPGGGTGGQVKGKTTFVPGGSIGVQLIRGDMSATGIGTVTALRGKNVLAFGHPMFNMGEGYFPVTTAHIHTVISSLMRSNKLGSPLEVAGSLVQDRNAGIVARTDKRAEMIPVKVAVYDARSKRREVYNVEIVSHRQLTPRFLQAALVNIITHAASDATDVTAEMTGELKVAGRDKITLRDSGASRTGLVPLSRFFRPVGIVASVLDNPFEEAWVESVDLSITLRYGLQVATIVGAYLTAEEPEPGEVVSVHVRLRRYDASERVLSVPVRIPEAAAGQKIKLDIAGGDFISPVMPAPQSLDDIIANVKSFYPPKSLVIGLNVPGEGVELRGRVIERLPASAMDALQPKAGFDQVASHRTAIRKVTPTPYLVLGSETVSLTVGGRRQK